MKKVENDTLNDVEAGSASIKALVLGARDWIKYFLSKWFVILIFVVLGSALGFIYAFNQKPLYVATTSFVLETNNKNNGLSSYSSLASSIGIDLGLPGSGLFEGENILELYRSRKMITKALLSEALFNGKKQLLVERFTEFNGLKNQWRENNVLKGITFRASNVYSTSAEQILHDSLLSKIVETIKNNCLSVARKDKKLNILNISVNSGDELFAKSFNEQLVKGVNEFYLDIKSQKAVENVAILQAKADSVRNVLSGSINKAAVISDATPNQNPTRMAQRTAPIQNLKSNAELSQNVLGVLLQNLEMAKISLSKETPLIQVVDEPILPLEKKRIGKLKSLVVGGILGFILILGAIIVRRVIKSALLV